MLTNPSTPTTQPAQRAARFTLTLDRVWVVAALLLIALRPLLTPIPPNDLWWHLATGRIIASTGDIPAIDTFSYTRAGQPFYNQSWLAQLLMYALYQVGGIPILIVAQALVITLAYGLLLRLCIRRTGHVRLSVGLLLLTTLPLSVTNWFVRPQSYVLPIFAAFLTILSEYRLGMNRRLWLLPPLMVLWVNIHGSFVLGLALIGITFAGEALKSFSRYEDRRQEAGDRRQEIGDRRQETGDRRQETGASLVSGLSARLGSRFSVLGSLAFWGIITAAAMLLNPRGFAVLGYVSNLIGSNAVMTLVTEWAPPTIRDTDGKIFFAFLIGCGAVFIYARRRPDLTDMLLFGAFLWLALGAGRNAVWFGMVATPLLAVQAATMLAEPRARAPYAGSPLLNGALVGMLALLVVLALPWIKPALGLPPSIGALILDETPVQAVAFLRAQPDRPKHLFHTEAYGSYLIWAAPEQPVFVDTRIELYPYDLWRDYINLGQANNTAALIQKYAIDGMLLSSKYQQPLIDALRADAGWVERYRDEQTSYFTRASGP